MFSHSFCAQHGAKIIVILKANFFTKQSQMQDIFAKKMQEYRKEGKLRDYPNDCGMVDIYAVD